MKPTHRTAALAALATSLSALASAATAEDVQVKFWSLKNPGFAEFVDIAKESFAEKHPDVEIVFEDFPNEAYKTAIQVALTGSDGPDAFYNWVGEDSARFVREGLALDISEYGTGPDGFQSVLSDGWLSAMRYDDGLYGVPVEAVSKFFYYSVPYFEEHGLEVPTSFDGVIETCKAIREIDPDTVPLPLGNSERWKVNHYITMLNERVLGHEQTSDDYDLSAADEELFTDPGFVTAWEKLLEMQDAGCFQDAPNATSPEISRAMFSSGASPMIYCGSWCAGIFDGDGFTDYATFRMPAMEDGTGDADTNFVLVQGLPGVGQDRAPRGDGRLAQPPRLGRDRARVRRDPAAAALEPGAARDLGQLQRAVQVDRRGRQLGLGPDQRARRAAREQRLGGLPRRGRRDPERHHDPGRGDGDDPRHRARGEGEALTGGARPGAATARTTGDATR